MKYAVPFHMTHDTTTGNPWARSEKDTISFLYVHGAEPALKMKAISSSETSATQATSAWCKHPKGGSTFPLNPLPSTLNVRDQVSHPYKTTGKITVFIFHF
jgi:hypothetical protein